MKSLSAVILLSITWPAQPLSAAELGNAEQKNVCLDVAGAQASAGAAVQLWHCGGGLNQQFSLLGNQSFTLNNGATVNEVEIFAMGGAFCLDANQAGIAPLVTTVQIWNCNHTGAQAWVYLGQTGQIMNVNANLCLDNLGGGIGKQLRLNLCLPTASQVWRIDSWE